MRLDLERLYCLSKTIFFSRILFSIITVYKTLITTILNCHLSYTVTLLCPHFLPPRTTVTSPPPLSHTCIHLYLLHHCLSISYLLSISSNLNLSHSVIIISSFILWCISLTIDTFAHKIQSFANTFKISLSRVHIQFICCRVKMLGLVQRLIHAV